MKPNDGNCKLFNNEEEEEDGEEGETNVDEKALILVSAEAIPGTESSESKIPSDASISPSAVPKPLSGVFTKHGEKEERRGDAFARDSQCRSGEVNFCGATDKAKLCQSNSEWLSERRGGGDKSVSKVLSCFSSSACLRLEPRSAAMLSMAAS